jgi:hypothetical protein
VIARLFNAVAGGFLEAHLVRWALKAQRLKPSSPRFNILMSAKEFYHKNDPHIPYLPPELWTQIIRHATWVPGGYDPELTELAVSVNANTMNKERLEAWKKALVSQLNTCSNFMLRRA